MCVSKSRAIALSMTLIAIFFSGITIEAKDGVITCTKKGKLLVSKKDYSDYTFEFEFKLTPEANNGIGIHYPGHGDPAFAGSELQILDNSAPRYARVPAENLHASLSFAKAAKKGHLKPVGEWNHQKIIVKKQHVEVILNGTSVLVANTAELVKQFPDKAGLRRTSGRIVLCGHKQVLYFRNMKLVDHSTQEDKAFTPLTSKDDPELSAWKMLPGHIGHWMMNGDILHYDAKSTEKDRSLWTKKDYQDFTLKFDWRWAASAKQRTLRPIIDPKTGGHVQDQNGKAVQVKVDEFDSGVYLRGNSKSQVNLWNWSCGSGEVYGYRTDKRFPQEIRAAVTPKVNMDNPIGHWNSMEITLIKDRLTVVLNGSVVIDNAQLPGVPPSGALALQDHGNEIDFRNIRILER